MSLKWVAKKDKYTSGEECFLGSVCVGSAFYSGMVSREDPNKYAASTFLPQLKLTRQVERFATQEEAKHRVEKAVESWLKMAGLARSAA